MILERTGPSASASKSVRDSESDIFKVYINIESVKFLLVKSLIG